jgi:hypothetical protein
LTEHQLCEGQDCVIQNTAKTFVAEVLFIE